MRWALLLTIATLMGCGLTFKPEREGQVYPAMTHQASRLMHPGKSSCEIGVIVFDGSIDDRWEDVAQTAAENGGTHYYARARYGRAELVTNGSTYGGSFSARSHVERSVHTVVVVYRNEDGGCVTD